MSTLTCPACGPRPEIGSAPFACECGELLDVEHALGTARRGGLEGHGVWRWRALVDPDATEPVSLGEGSTPLLRSPAVARYAGIEELWLKHEGMNPTGSFKDRGMTVALSRARDRGARTVACASTGNTAASLAAYAARAELRALVLVPAGATARGKLAQAIAYGARAVELRGDFDAAMRLARELAAEGELALLNSANPWRVEGQKTIVLELCEELGWDPPDWIVFPAGNLGNCAAFGKALRELARLGWIARAPRLAAVQAEGAAPFARAFERGFERLEPVKAETLATAIRIGDPVSWRRAARAIRETRGTVLAVTDDAILDAKAVIDAAGVGAEPASCAAVAGARELRRRGAIAPGERVACVLTGHLLKDPDTTLAYHEGRLAGIRSERARPPVAVDSAEALRALLGGE